MFGPRTRLAVLAVVVAGAFLAVALTGDLSAKRIQRDLDGTGWAAPLVFVVVSSLLTVACFPGPILAAASGLLFGTLAGTPISIVSATLGATLAFSLSRWWAHDAVDQLARGRLDGLRRWVGERGFSAVLLARCAPAVPYNLVNYAAGLTPVRIGAFVAATALGCAPRAFAYTALGGNFGDFSNPVTYIAVIVLVGMALLGAWLLRRDVRAPTREDLV